MKTQLDVINYKANAGYGIIFPAKMFTLETQKQLTIISPCKIPDETINQLKNKKKEINIISPNNFHNLYLNFMSTNFPDANFYGPKRSEKLSGVKLELTNNLKIENVEPILINGHDQLAESVFYIKDLKVLIATDLLFNMPKTENMISSLVFLLAGTYKSLGMSKLLRKSVSDKALFKKSLLNLQDLDFSKVLLNHGDNITRDEFFTYIKETL